MTHPEVLKQFKIHFAVKDTDIDCWYPNGKNSIRIRSVTYGDLIFTYHNKKKWRLESVESYLDSIKVEVPKEV